LGLHGTTPLWERGQFIGTDVAGRPLLCANPPTLGRAMVVSQGCELVKTSFPFATVVPVYDGSQVLNEQQQASARSGGTWHLVHLTAEWAAAGFWVADLRMETAVDKTLLVAAEPIEPFADETSYPRLAERLAAARQRPAIPQPCLDFVVAPLKEHLAGRVSDGATPLDGVREVRVLCDHPMAPTTVTLFVVSHDAQHPNEDEWLAAFDAVHQVADEHGIALSGPEIGSLWDMTAADYLNSQAVSDADSS